MVMEVRRSTNADGHMVIEITGTSVRATCKQVPVGEGEEPKLDVTLDWDESSRKDTKLARWLLYRMGQDFPESGLRERYPHPPYAH